ncbi:MAG: alpha/beta hydrolase [Pseudomonadota bacterium]
MDWLLAALALFNLVSIITVFSARGVERLSPPWALFITAALTIELAWIWLPLQIVITAILVYGGALHSGLGVVSLIILLGSWPGLVWCVYQSKQAETAMEQGLRAALGHQYRNAIPPSASHLLRNHVTFSDWANPFGMRLPGVELIRNIPYGPAGVRQQLDIYRPQHIPAEGCPVLLQIHGGAWMIGDKGSQALPLMNHLASRGWICVAANYRLSPSVGFPTHLEDCKRALCWIRRNGKEYGMNPNFVAVTGGSAGGHLSALMGLTANRSELQADAADVDTSVQACIPFYGIYDFLVRFEQHPNRQAYEKFLSGRVLHESRQHNPDLWDLASPIAHIHADAPPFMVLHGALDSLAAVSEGRVFSEKLKEVSGSPVVYIEYPGAEHGWDAIHSLRTEHTIDGVHRFLEWVRSNHSGEYQS